jgi:hypothetical protein
MKAIYLDDTKNYHKFVIVEGGMGSIYQTKGITIPSKVEVELIDPADSRYPELKKAYDRTQKERTSYKSRR